LQLNATVSQTLKRTLFLAQPSNVSYVPHDASVVLLTATSLATVAVECATVAGSAGAASFRKGTAVPATSWVFRGRR